MRGLCHARVAENVKERLKQSALAVAIATSVNGRAGPLAEAVETDHRFALFAHVSAIPHLAVVAARHTPDVLLVDASLIDAATGIGPLGRHRIVAIVADHLCTETMALLGRAGVRGAVLATDSIDDVHRAIREVVDGGYWVSPSLGGQLLAADPDCPPDAVTTLTDLTVREREVLSLIGRGLNNADIANSLFISLNTVKFHVRNLLAKLGARDRAQLVAVAHGAVRTTPRGGDLTARAT